MGNFIRFWINNARHIALPQSAMPAIVAFLFCIGQPGFCWWVGLIAIVGIMTAHLGMNLADDYFDYSRDSRLRSELSSTSVRARMDKCMYITSGQTTIQATKKAVVYFLLLAGCLGLIVVVAQGFLIGWQQALAVGVYAVLGLLLGLSYAGGPLKLSFYGLGELVIGMMFGPLLMLGLQAGCTSVVFSWPMFWLSVALGCMVMNILYVHSVMEVEADAELGKMTLARLLKNKVVQIVCCGIFCLAPFAILTVGIFAMKWWSPWYLLTLLTLPMSLKLLVSLSRFTFHRPTLDNPEWWMGPMGDFESYRKAGIDWFLFRWLLARNCLTFFCIILVMVRIVLLILA